VVVDDEQVAERMKGPRKFVFVPTAIENAASSAPDNANSRL
jgi:hypothetical protein